jgi:hypothetical protein
MDKMQADANTRSTILSFFAWQIIGSLKYGRSYGFKSGAKSTYFIRIIFIADWKRDRIRHIIRRQSIGESHYFLHPFQFSRDELPAFAIL